MMEAAGPIAVLSDTHDRIARLPWEALGRAAEIWHLGDVCDPGIVARLCALGPPVLVVRGNCDTAVGWPPVIQIDRAGLRIRLQHHLPERLPPGVDLLLHGHTHVPCDISAGGIRILNPGSAGLANKGAPSSLAWLRLGPKGVEFEISRLG